MNEYANFPFVAVQNMIAIHRQMERLTDESDFEFYIGLPSKTSGVLKIVELCSSAARISETLQVTR